MKKRSDKAHEHFHKTVEWLMHRVISGDVVIESAKTEIVDGVETLHLSGMAKVNYCSIEFKIEAPIVEEET